MMHPDHVLPAVSRLMQQLYTQRIEAHRVSQALAPWPKRRSSRRKPYPGLYDETLQDEG